MRRPYPFDEIPYNGVSYPLDYLDSNHYPQYNRKRQRRQAAAIVVESLWNGNSKDDTSGDKTSTTPTRKSTAQPRPVLTIPPKGIGPIADPNVNDVLCGRGGRINSHAGNVQFRDTIHSRKKEYLAPTTKKLEKAHIAAGIVNDIRSMDPPGRFLKEEKGTGMWYDIGDAKAIKKTGQALREDAPDIRPAIDENGGGSSGDEKKPSPIKTSENTGMVMASVKSNGVSLSNVSSRGNQALQQNLIPILPQQQGYNNNNNNSNSNSIAQQQRSAPDYHAQTSMPPPFHPYQAFLNNNNFSSQQVSQQQQFMQQQQPLQNQQGFQTRNIPIQLPLGANQGAFPSQVYSGVQSSTNKFGSASRKAMEALSEAGPRVHQQYAQYGGQPQIHPDDIAFGMSFNDPINPNMISDDNTISTISGLSEPVSSLTQRSSTGSRGPSFRVSDLMNMSMKSNAGRPSMGTSSDLMNMSVKSNFSLTDSFRLKSSMNSSNNHNRYDTVMPVGGSIRSGSNKSYIMDLNGSIKSGHSLTRSNSCDSFRFDLNEGNMMDESAHMLGRRTSSGMSIGSIMDLQSNASSTEWFKAAVSNLPAPDEKSVVSSAMMSADLDALDLALNF